MKKANEIAPKARKPIDTENMEIRKHHSITKNDNAKNNKIDVLGDLTFNHLIEPFTCSNLGFICIFTLSFTYLNLQDNKKMTILKFKFEYIL